MSLFKNKNKSNSNKEPIIKIDTNVPVQSTPPTDNSKLWVDTSTQ